MTAAPIVTFSSIDWDYVWQGHQEVMTRLAAAGHPVLFVENTGLRRPRFSDWSRVRRRAQTLAATRQRLVSPVPGLQVLAPRIVPLPYWRPAIALNTRLLDGRIRHWLDAQTGRPIVWTYLPTPLVHALANRLQRRLLIYYCVDDLPASSDLARQVVPSENEMFRKADLVFVTSERLRDKALQHRSTVHLFPSGVSYERFESARQNPPPAPDDIRSIPRPTVAYVGAVHRWFDLELLAQVARHLPNVHFLLIGPVLVPTESLTPLPNVHLLGARSHDDIPAYLAHADVGIIPYVRDDYTASVFPTKLPEYLAMGLPVVSTSIPEVLAFKRRHGDVVEIADAPDGFASAIARAVAMPAPESIRGRRCDVAKSQGWDVRVAAMRELIEAALAGAAPTGAR